MHDCREPASQASNQALREQQSLLTRVQTQDKVVLQCTPLDEATCQLVLQVGGNPRLEINCRHVPPLSGECTPSRVTERLLTLSIQPGPYPFTAQQQRCSQQSCMSCIVFLTVPQNPLVPLSASGVICLVAWLSGWHMGLTLARAAGGIRLSAELCGC